MKIEMRCPNGHREIIDDSRFSIENFIFVKDWTIENSDFRELFKRYNKTRVLLYLDPPYLSSGKRYKYRFNLEDLKQLKECIENHSGSYLMNLSSYDAGMEEIFGNANRVINYSNPLIGNGKERWGCGYWWKFNEKNE